MLALQKLRPGPGVELLQVAPPRSLPPGEVLIKVHMAGICGTDLHIAQWTPGYESMKEAMPVTLGHEFAGVRGRGRCSGCSGRQARHRAAIHYLWCL